ncbi:MAG: heparinase II/III domain-containing protein [Bacillota bacterium]
MLLRDERRLRCRLSDPAFAPAVAALQTMAARVADRPVTVPPGGIAGWNHQYICPEHAVMLEFDWDRPHEHRCPVDGRLHRSPLLDAAWWRQVNGHWSEGAFAMAALWRLTGEDRYLAQVRAILLAYAERYPSYEVHGGIPFNGPGKANVQTLCEATWSLSLAWAYHLVQPALEPADDGLIREDLLACSARFLIDHHERQLHNHQCWIAAAIATIGLVLGHDPWVEYGVNGPYGLAQQLDQGVMGDGFWLEGSVGYHMHALRPLCRFAQLARGTPWAMDQHPKLRAMFRPLRHMLQPDGSYPHINDVVGVNTPKALLPMLEMAYGWDQDPELGALLREALGGADRSTPEALLFGADRIDSEHELPPLGHYSSEANGLSVIRHGPSRFFLMVKHGDGGNEHDHFDRLGLAFLAHGERIAPDIGTVYYGHPLHWAWYKTTLSHNTVSLGGMPHPPARAGVYRFAAAGAEQVTLDTWAAWPKGPDYYSNARFRRLIIWTPDYFVDHFIVRTEAPTRVEYLFHTPGRLSVSPEGRPYAEWNPLPAYQHLEELRVRPLAPEGAALGWSFPGTHLWARLAAGAPTLLVDGLSPDSPPSRRRSSLLLRQEEQTRTFFTAAFEINSTPRISGLRAIQTGESAWEIHLAYGSRTDQWTVSQVHDTAPADITLIKG